MSATNHFLSSIEVSSVVVFGLEYMLEGLIGDCPNVCRSYAHSLPRQFQTFPVVMSDSVGEGPYPLSTFLL